MRNIYNWIRNSTLFCCQCNAILIAKTLGYLIGIAPFIFALFLVSRDRPGFYLDDLHVSTLLKKTLNSSSATNTTTMIHFDLMIENSELFYGLYYKDPLKLTFTYFPPPINKINANVTIGIYPIQGFYQGLAKVKHVRDSVVVQDILSVAKRLKGPAKVALLSVELDARVKFKSIEHRKIHLAARAFVEINCNTGNIVLNKNNFPLHYISGSDKWKFLQWLAFTFLLIIFLTMVCCCMSRCC